MTAQSRGLVIPAGMIVQVSYAELLTVQTGTTAMPYDDTIPQNTEGDQYLTLAHTPLAAANDLILVSDFIVSDSGATRIGHALFQDAIANALAYVFTIGAAVNCPMVSPMIKKVNAASTTARTYKIRIGPESGTLTVNGSAAARKGGGVAVSSLTIYEVKR